MKLKTQTQTQTEPHGRHMETSVDDYLSLGMGFLHPFLTAKQWVAWLQK